MQMNDYFGEILTLLVTGVAALYKSHLSLNKHMRKKNYDMQKLESKIDILIESIYTLLKEYKKCKGINKDISSDKKEES